MWCSERSPRPVIAFDERHTVSAGSGHACGRWTLTTRAPEIADSTASIADHGGHIVSLVVVVTGRGDALPGGSSAAGGLAARSVTASITPVEPLSRWR
jgi:hypothetical protein